MKEVVRLFMDYARTHPFAPMREGETVRGWAQRVWNEEKFAKGMPGSSRPWMYFIHAVADAVEQHFRDEAARVTGIPSLADPIGRRGASGAMQAQTPLTSGEGLCLTCKSPIFWSYIRTGDLVCGCGGQIRMEKVVWHTEPQDAPAPLPNSQPSEMNASDLYAAMNRLRESDALRHADTVRIYRVDPTPDLMHEPTLGERRAAEIEQKKADGWKGSDAYGYNPDVD